MKVEAGCRLANSSKIYSFCTTKNPYKILTRGHGCGCPFCMSQRYDRCDNAARYGLFKESWILRSGDAAVMAAADLQQEEEEDERAEDYASLLPAPTLVAAAFIVADSDEAAGTLTVPGDEPYNFTIVELNCTPAVRQPGSPALVSRHKLFAGSAASGYDEVECPPVYSLVVSGYAYRRALMVDVSGEMSDRRYASMFERLKEPVYFPAELIRHSRFKLELMPPEYMAKRAAAIASAPRRPAGSKPRVSSLATALDTDGQLYRLHADDASVIAEAMGGRRTL